VISTRKEIAVRKYLNMAINGFFTIVIKLKRVQICTQI